MDIKEFVNQIVMEIDDALTSNYDARKEKLDYHESKGTDSSNDDFLSYVDGKIHALRGIKEYIEGLSVESQKPYHNPSMICERCGHCTVSHDKNEYSRCNYYECDVMWYAGACDNFHAVE